VLAAVLGFAGLASAAGVITLTPSEGAPGTPYVVKVDCGQAPDLYGRPLNEQGPPGTLLPLAMKEVAPSTWQVDEVAGLVDDVYGGNCGDDRLDARFDTDNPRMYLGPIPESPFQNGPRTTVEGTDCPAGTQARVAFHHDGQTDTVDVATNSRGDWTTLLPGQAGTEDLTIDASCGSVTYDPITIRAATTQPTDNIPTNQCGTQPRPCPADEPPLIASAPTPAPAAPATGAVPVAGTATFTG